MNKDDLLKMVGANIKKYRNEKNMTQDELAEKAQISTSFCANIERGQKGMSLTVLRDIADALDVTADSLLYEKSTDQAIRSLEAFLSTMPEDYVEKIEKMARLFADHPENCSDTVSGGGVSEHEP